MSAPELEQRMESLEMRLMHLEAALDEMTRSLLRQEQLTRTQAETIKRLEEQFRGLAAGYPATPEAEPPPPHY
ncbi:MAG: SlyX family protein [Gammaproteobacteria bacterium]